MRLTAGGIRELHWHQAAEWAYMTHGHCRVTVIDPMGRPYVADVKEGDIWYFPAGYPHSLQGLGPDGCEFVICFDDGAASEFNTLLVTDWFAHTPPAVLAENFGVPAKTFAKTPLNDLWIFQGKVPGDLPAVRKAMTGNAETPPQPFTFSLATSPNLNGTKSGTVQLADSSNFKISTTIAAVVQTVPPGAMRSMHWHPNADEWQYYISGRGRMTVVATGNRARTLDFQAGDVGYVEKTLLHYVENTGDTDLVFLEIFKSSFYQDFSLSEWLAHTPPELVMAHLHIDKAALDAIPKEEPVIMPG
jgi:oxalate decarboxylase